MLKLSETMHHGLGAGCRLGILGLHYVPISTPLHPHLFFCNRGTFDQLAYSLTVAVIHWHSQGGSTADSNRGKLRLALIHRVSNITRPLWLMTKFSPIHNIY